MRALLACMLGRGTFILIRLGGRDTVGTGKDEKPVGRGVGLGGFLGNFGKIQCKMRKPKIRGGFQTPRENLCLKFVKIIIKMILQFIFIQQITIW